MLRRERSWDHLARLAFLAAKTGDAAGAERLYAEAQEQLTAKEMRPYAWLELQRGVLDLERGDAAAALGRFERADRAYSGYWLIEEHLAEALHLLGRTDEAVARYRRVVARAPRPELLSALAGVLAPSDPGRGRRLWTPKRRAASRRSTPSTRKPPSGTSSSTACVAARRTRGSWRWPRRTTASAPAPRRSSSSPASTWRSASGRRHGA